MKNDFLITYHPWNLLVEGLFPNDQQVAVMKGIMDGKPFSKIASELGIKSSEAEKLFKTGMKQADLKNTYELVVWGLRSGIIKDDEIPIEKMQVVDKGNPHPNYPEWINILNLTATGYSPDEISREGVYSKETVQRVRDTIARKFHLGPSLAEFIRFAFATVHPIKGPSSVRPPPGPFKASKGPYQTIDNPPMKIGSYRPADVDLTINPRFQPKMGKGRVGSIYTAFELLGLDVKKICSSMLKGRSESSSDLDVRQIMGSFWKKPEWVLWKLLETARDKFKYEIAHHHTDRNKSSQSVIRAKQLNVAWKFIKDMFGRRGFVLGGGESTEKRFLVPPDLRAIDRVARKLAKIKNLVAKRKEKNWSGG